MFCRAPNPLMWNDADCWTQFISHSSTAWRRLQICKHQTGLSPDWLIQVTTIAVTSYLCARWRHAAPYTSHQNSATRHQFCRRVRMPTTIIVIVRLNYHINWAPRWGQPPPQWGGGCVKFERLLLSSLVPRFMFQLSVGLTSTRAFHDEQ